MDLDEQQKLKKITWHWKQYSLTAKNEIGVFNILTTTSGIVPKYGLETNIIIISYLH